MRSAPGEVVGRSQGGTEEILGVSPRAPADEGEERRPWGEGEKGSSSERLRGRGRFVAVVAVALRRAFLPPETAASAVSGAPTAAVAGDAGLAAPTAASRRRRRRRRCPQTGTGDSGPGGGCCCCRPCSETVVVAVVVVVAGIFDEVETGGGGPADAGAWEDAAVQQGLGKKFKIGIRDVCARKSAFK